MPKETDKKTLKGEKPQQIVPAFVGDEMLSLAECFSCNALLFEDENQQLQKLFSGGGRKVCSCPHCQQKYMLIRESVRDPEKPFTSPRSDTLFVPVKCIA